MGTGRDDWWFVIVVGGSDFCGWLHADFAVGATIVAPVDVGQGGPFDGVDILQGSASVDQFDLVEPVE